MCPCGAAPLLEPEAAPACRYGTVGCKIAGDHDECHDGALGCDGPLRPAPPPPPEPSEGTSEWVLSQLQMIAGFPMTDATEVLRVFEARTRQDERERAARAIEAKCGAVLAKQYDAKDEGYRDSVDVHIRMMAVLLPELAAAIREGDGR